MSSSGSKGALGIGGAYALNSNNNGGHQQQQQQQQQLQLTANAGNGGTSGGTSATTATTALQTGLLHCPTGSGNGNGSGGGDGSGGNGGGGGNNSLTGGAGYDHSVSEAISNISSPDYQDDDNLLSSRDLAGGMVLSDPSDSDSTILVSDTAATRQKQKQQQHQQLQLQAQALHQQQQQQQKMIGGGQQGNSEQHKLVIQVRGIDNSNSASARMAYSEMKDSEDELATLTEEPLNSALAAACGDSGGTGRDSSPPVSDDGSDVESLHSYHYSPKAVDMPSAIRLAKRLYSLDGFKKSDVSRHLSKK